MANKKKRADILIDGSVVVTLDVNVIRQNGLRPGQELSQAALLKLQEADYFQRCLDAALNFLSYRPRSESEVRQRLSRRGFDRQTIEKTVKRLKKQALINDMEFAAYWRDNRISFNPKSRFIIKKELKQKGIPSDITDTVTEGIDEEAAALAAVRKKAVRWSNLEYEEFHIKVTNYLKWRGFNYGICEKICRLLREENQT
ncbi:MAG TPA: RecX family transcriptional regulator [Dehalococcoidia bacterium]|nr:RecX family transcriptional regulator [Dehalococcoidia bacterium]